MQAHGWVMFGSRADIFFVNHYQSFPTTMSLHNVTQHAETFGKYNYLYYLVMSRISFDLKAYFLWWSSLKWLCSFSTTSTTEMPTRLQCLTVLNRLKVAINHIEMEFWFPRTHRVAHERDISANRNTISPRRKPLAPEQLSLWGCLLGLIAASCNYVQH